MAEAPDPWTLIVPQDTPEHPGPETAQEMAKSGFEFGIGVSMADKLAVAAAATAEGPVTVKVKLLVTMIAAVAFFDGSATLVTVTISVGGEGRICGAVKTPFELTEPHEDPPQPAPLSAQVNPVFGFPADTMPA